MQGQMRRWINMCYVSDMVCKFFEAPNTQEFRNLSNDFWTKVWRQELNLSQCSNITIPAPESYARHARLVSESGLLHSQDPPWLPDIWWQQDGETDRTGPNFKGPRRPLERRSYANHVEREGKRLSELHCCCCSEQSPSVKFRLAFSLPNVPSGNPYFSTWVTNLAKKVFVY